MKGPGSQPRTADRVQAGHAEAPDPAEEFPGFAPLAFVGYARNRLAEVVVTGGDVRAGELVQPLDITAERFDGGVVASTVFADVVPSRQGCHHGVMVPCRAWSFLHGHAQKPLKVSESISRYRR